MPSTVPRSISERIRTESSSAVWAGFVPTRNCFRERIALEQPEHGLRVTDVDCEQHRSDRAKRGLLLFVLRPRLGHPLGELVRRERRLLAVGPSSSTVTSPVVSTSTRGIIRVGRLLFQTQTILQLELAERIRRLRHVLHVELVAEIRRCPGSERSTGTGVNGAVLLLQPQLELGLVIV